MAIPNLNSANIFPKIFLILFSITCLLLISFNIITPNVEVQVAIEPSYNVSELLNLTNFDYALNNERCRMYGKDLLAIILVTSTATNTALRTAHRQAMPQCKLAKLGFQRVFLLAKIPPTEGFIKQAHLEHEHKRFDDLVQGNFVDSYRNLSYKHIMGLRWAGYECANAKFVIKMNDDIIYDVYHIHNYLNELVKNPTYNSSGELLAGALFRAGKPSRNKTSKWYVPMEEYSESVYPDYVSGWFYITNLLTSKYIAKEAQKTPFFWIDDVFVTGIIRQNLQINLLPLKSWIAFEKGALECCIEIAKTYSYYCDYKVGPIGSERGFMCKFQHAMEKCHLHQCIPRPPKTALNVLCGNIAAYSKIA